MIYIQNYNVVKDVSLELKCPSCNKEMKVVQGLQTKRNYRCEHCEFEDCICFENTIGALSHAEIRWIRELVKDEIWKRKQQDMQSEYDDEIFESILNKTENF